MLLLAGLGWWKRLRAGGGLSENVRPIRTRLTPSSVDYGNAPRDRSGALVYIRQRHFTSLRRIRSLSLVSHSRFCRYKVRSASIISFNPATMSKSTLAIFASISILYFATLCSSQSTTLVTAVKQTSDGQVQVQTSLKTVKAVSQISDGQIQVHTSAGPVTQISDGQIQVHPTPPPVTQISDGQIQVHTSTAPVSVKPSSGSAKSTGAVSKTSNATTVAPATKAPAATFTGAAAFVAWSTEIAVAAGVVAAGIAML